MNVEVQPLTPQGKPWTPRVFQKEIIKKFKEHNSLVLTITRQVGKTEACILVLYHFLFFYKKRLHPVAHVYMQDYKQVNSIYLNRLMTWLDKIPGSLLTSKQVKDSNSRGYIILKRPWLGDVCTIYFMSHNAAKGIRGGTSDLVILDEGASCRKDDWWQRISPTRDDTGGKAIVTSTYDGPNWYFQLQEFAKEEEKRGLGTWASILYDLEDMVAQGVRTREWADAKRREYEKAGNLSSFLQEYMCDPYAGAEGEYPYGSRLHATSKGVIPVPPVDKRRTTVFTTLDIGKGEKMPSWSYILNPYTNNPCVIGFQRRHDSFEAIIKYLLKDYGDYGQLVVFLPHDGVQNISGLGMSQVDLFRLLLKQAGLTRKIKVDVLAKPTDKNAYLKHTIHTFCDWDYADTHDVIMGRDSLRRFRFRRDAKTGMILEFQAEKNMSVHVSDALCYMVHSLFDATKYAKVDRLDMYALSGNMSRVRKYTRKKRRNVW